MLILSIATVALLAPAISSHASFSLVSRCPEIRSYSYPDGGEIAPVIDDRYEVTDGTTVREPEVDNSAVPGGVAIVESLQVGAAQGIGTAQWEEPPEVFDAPDIYRRLCGNAAVYTSKGKQTIPVFIAGGTLYLSDGTSSWFVRDYGIDIYADGPFCMPGKLQIIDENLVLLVDPFSDNVCEMRLGKPYVRIGKSGFVSIDSKSGRKKLTPVPNVKLKVPGPLDTALLFYR